MDRPHIIYCEKTGKYVAWLKIMAGEVSQFMTIMEADTFMGPYRMVHKMYKPLYMDSGDLALHVDKETADYLCAPDSRDGQTNRLCRPLDAPVVGAQNVEADFGGNGAAF